MLRDGGVDEVGGKVAVDRIKREICDENRWYASALCRETVLSLSRNHMQMDGGRHTSRERLHRLGHM